MISVIIPVRDEEKNVDELVSRLVGSLETISGNYEVIFVTDINKDNTYGVICDKNAGNDRIKAIKLTNGFGQHIAILAGLNSCCGEYAVIMDGDMQDCPEDIPKLMKKIQEGYDVVYGVKERKNGSAFRNLSSKTFNFLMSVFAEVKMDNNTSLFRMISRRAIDELCKFKEIEPSLTYIFGLINLPTATVRVESGERKTGKTKYSLSRLIRFAISSLISFSRKPLVMISRFGFLTALLGFAYLVVVLIQLLTIGIPISGWATIIILILLIGGIQLISIGVLGEYIGRIYLQTKNRPLYIIESRVGDFPGQGKYENKS